MQIKEAIKSLTGIMQGLHAMKFYRIEPIKSAIACLKQEDISVAKACHYIGRMGGIVCEYGYSNPSKKSRHFYRFSYRLGRIADRLSKQSDETER